MTKIALLAIVLIATSNSAWAADPGNRQMGRYQVAQGYEKTILVDTQTGQSWLLKENPNSRGYWGRIRDYQTALFRPNLS